MKAKKTKNLGTLQQVVVDEVITKQVAALSIAGKKQTEIAADLGISYTAVRGICKTEKYHELVKMTGEEALGPLIAAAKAGLARLSAKAVRVVEKAMDQALEGSGSMREGLAAAQVALKAVGIHEDANQQADMQIIVQLPNGVIDHKTIEVINEEV